MMKEILITSSALILALLVIRQIFKGVLSRRVQYALWGLVLVRLLVPVSLLPAADFSVLTATQPMEQAVAERINLNRIFYSRPQGQVSRQELAERDIDPEDVPTAQDLFVLGESDPDNRFSTNWLVRDPETNVVTRYEEMKMGPWDILDRVWKVGMILMGAFFLLSNLAFYCRLRRNRRPYASLFEGAARKVYLVPEGVIPSPCLFGRSIYITPAVAEDEKKLRHVLAHEETHARHWDPVWSLLRCVCLTVYWFDPLVWIAAHCSRADCELACDEGALRILGEEERIPYGQTLLSLIPVKRASNPMIAATTMTAGKKQLKDRVKRIAGKPRQLAAAALAAAVLAGVVSACTFTGGKGEPTPSPSQGPTENTFRPLTGEELRWFNEEFFNSSGSGKDQVYAVSGDGYQEYYNIRNQFLNSAFNLYEKPEDIDLFQLFYCDGTMLSGEEHNAIWGEEMNCPEYKITAEEMDEILKEHTGLTLEQTNKVGLENFTYQNDTYYWGHGDTNYPGDIEIVCGTREGSTVRLYHHGGSSGSKWYCTTLEAQSDGGYWFVSNQESQAPAIPTPLPAWDPVASIDLSALEPYAAPAVTVTDYPNHYSFHYETCYANWNLDGRHIMVYRAEDGVVYAAYEENDVYHVFLSGLNEYAEVFFFHDLLGQDGFFVKYDGQYSEHAYGTVYDYYYFNTDGVLTLLARCESHGSEAFALDLDGDGQQELCAKEQIFFLREGTVYEARLPELLTQACPELSYWDYGIWDRYGKVLRASGLADGQEPGDYGYNWIRQLYFTGESLLVYKDEAPTVDHMVVGADAGVPAVVVEKAMEAVQLGLVEVEGFYRRSSYQEQEADGYTELFDDWRIRGFYGPTVITLGGVRVEAWSFTSEVHAVEPGKIVIAGGNYLTEEGWTWNYTADNTIFLRREEDGSLTYLWTRYDDGTLDSHMGREGLARDMEEHGVELAEGYSYAGLWFREHLSYLTDCAAAESELRIQYEDEQGHGSAYTLDPSEGNGPYYLNQMKDNDVVWSRAQAPATEPQEPSVTLSSPDWYETLRFWKDSGLVMYKTQNEDPEWYEVKYDGDPTQDVFAYRALPYYWARCWFDDGEQAALEARLPLIPAEEGQSYLNIAREWAENHEGLMTRLYPGGSYTCTFVKVTDVEILENQPESWFPADILDVPHFAFSFRTVFVPENEDALNNLMAGNTGEYKGNDPDVPEGAFEYSRRGSMWFSEKDNVWACAGIGTG